jgi:hypothetical protein
MIQPQSGVTIQRAILRVNRAPIQNQLNRLLSRFGQFWTIVLHARSMLLHRNIFIIFIEGPNNILITATWLLTLRAFVFWPHRLQDGLPGPVGCFWLNFARFLHKNVWMGNLSGLLHCQRLHHDQKIVIYRYMVNIHIFIEKSHCLIVFEAYMNQRSVRVESRFSSDSKHLNRLWIDISNHQLWLSLMNCICNRYLQDMIRCHFSSTLNTRSFLPRNIGPCLSNTICYLVPWNYFCVVRSVWKSDLGGHIHELGTQVKLTGLIPYVLLLCVMDYNNHKIYRLLSGICVAIFTDIIFSYSSYDNGQYGHLWCVCQYHQRMMILCNKKTRSQDAQSWDNITIVGSNIYPRCYLYKVRWLMQIEYSPG